MKPAGIKPADARAGAAVNAVTPAAPAAPPPADAGDAEPRPRKAVSPLYRAVQVVASLRLTVVLLGLSLFLVFAGTLAQIDAGIWSVVGQYFRSIVVWIPFQLFIKFG